jgi:MerR family transcriptional regulator, heat shock protein HspR
MVFNSDNKAMMKIKRKKGYFSISAVAKMFSVHQQTIRLYEKQGLIAPKRSTGNTRLFSEEDINRLEEVIYLTHELGINLAGVEMILKLKKQIKTMQKEMNKLFENTNKQLDKETEMSKQIIHTSTQRLLQIKQQKQEAAGDNKQESSQTVDIDNWEIEYEE